MEFTLKREWRCCHRSHHLGLRCRRTWVYDGYCQRHNASCFGRCDDSRWWERRMRPASKSAQQR